MFLDEKLLKICEDAIITPDGNDDLAYKEVNKVYQDVMKECETYYKSKMNPYMTNANYKAILDKTFNLFDSFVAMAEKSENHKANVLSGLFKKHTFRNQFMNNDDLRFTYEKL